MASTISDQRVRVELGERSYDIVIGSGLLARAGEVLEPLGLGNRGVIITDSNVKPLYAAKLRRVLKKGGRDVGVLSMPAGGTSQTHPPADRLSLTTSSL